MKAERWRQIREVLEAALALEGPERFSHLDKACARDAELRREVESLLQCHQQAGSQFLRAPAVDLIDLASPDEVPAPRVGRRLGVYQIMEEIAHGGMGEVYRAKRIDGQYEKEVAVKLVRVGLASSFLLDRFRHERQILAGLDHPNIALLLDGGTTEDGMPYLVMELVRGTPIDQYCDAHRLSITKRLELFRDVCAAMHYAHQRLVIHRDIKPGNLLVTEEGVPKLLDFGIAKIFDPSADAQTTLVSPMTPEYASPEQIRGEPITTATDVYSLGVVLYQLLTGHSPYLQDTRSAHELARAICDAEPVRPSTVVLKHGRNAPDPVKPSPEGSTLKLRRRLAGDLDEIVLMALRKEPGRRYASVEQFAEDIRNHLDRRPVIACKGSWNYRTGKFVKRHKAGVAATAAVLLALLGGIGATVRQAQIASRERARAERRFNDVRQLSDSLIFEVHDAIRNLEGATPARKLLLDRAVQYLDSVSKDSEGNTDLQRELALGYQRLAAVQGDPTQSNLGDPKAAEASLRKALTLFEAVAQANPGSITDQLNVAAVHRVLSFSSLFAPAGRRELNEATAITDRLMKADGANPKVAIERSIEYQNLGFMEDAAGNRAAALDAFRKNLAIKQEVLASHPDFPRIRERFGVASTVLADELVRLGLRREALQQLQVAIAALDSVLKDGPNLNVKREEAIAQVKRGEIQLMNGDSAGARTSFAQARSTLGSMATAEPQDNMLQLDVAAMDFEDGRLLTSEGKYAAAIPALRKAIRAYEALHTQNRSAGDVGASLGLFYAWLGWAQAAMGNLKGALETYRQASAELKSPSGQPLSVDTRCLLTSTYTKEGDALTKLGDFERAAGSYQKALGLVEPLISPEFQDVPALYAAADAYAGMGGLSMARSRRASNSAEKAGLVHEARTRFEDGSAAWLKVPNPSRISPTGLEVANIPKIAGR